MCLPGASWLFPPIISYNKVLGFSQPIKGPSPEDESDPVNLSPDNVLFPGDWFDAIFMIMKLRRCI